MSSQAAKKRSKDSYSLRVSLAPTNADPLAVGVAKFENNTHHRRLELIITNVFSEGNHQVRAKGRLVGPIWVDNHGCGKLCLDTREDDTVFLLKQADMVEVFNPANDLILIGSFNLMKKPSA